MQHIKGCCCYFRQGHFPPSWPPKAVSLPPPFSRLLFLIRRLEQERQICCFLTRLSAQPQSIWPTSPDIPAAFYLLSFIYFFGACTSLCSGACASVKFLLCVIKCVYATVFCVIVELLLGLSQNYYSVSAPLWRFISIFSPSFIHLSSSNHLNKHTHHFYYYDSSFIF